MRGRVNVCKLTKKKMEAFGNMKKKASEVEVLIECDSCKSTIYADSYIIKEANVT